LVNWIKLIPFTFAVAKQCFAQSDKNITFYIKLCHYNF
jgi:hypothetical protein